MITEPDILTPPTIVQLSADVDSITFSYTIASVPPEVEKYHKYFVYAHLPVINDEISFMGPFNYTDPSQVKSGVIRHLDHSTEYWVTIEVCLVWNYINYVISRHDDVMVTLPPDECDLTQMIVMTGNRSVPLPLGINLISVLVT